MAKVSRSLTPIVALREFVAAVEEDGDWDDGCFYYEGTSNTKLQMALLIAHQAIKEFEGEEKCQRQN